MPNLSEVIERAWERRTELSPTGAEPELREAVAESIAGLDSGTLRVAEKKDGRWIVNQWLKQAVLLSFRLNDNRVIDAGYTRFFDKVPLKYSQHDAEKFKAGGARVVPDAVVRRGAYIAPDVVLMPSFVNIGAYVDQGSMIDTWATVGSCAQIGKHVHLSGGAGIGGVLEPLQAAPTIIEDNCFIGARSEVVEGVIVERGSVLGMGVYIGQSTKYLRPCDRRDHVRPRAGGLRGRLGHPAILGRLALALLRRHRQTSRREDARQNLAERTASHGRLTASRSHQEVPVGRPRPTSPENRAHLRLGTEGAGAGEDVGPALGRPRSEGH